MLMYVSRSCEAPSFTQLVKHTQALWKAGFVPEVLTPPVMRKAGVGHTVDTDLSQAQLS